jgi:16S rRNA (cytidine1402-2'-O)-methyltransferase
LADWASGEVRGEITLVVAGAAPRDVPADLAGLVAQRESAGVARKDAIAEVAREHRVAKRDVYAAVVRAKDSLPVDRRG